MSTERSPEMDALAGVYAERASCVALAARLAMVAGFAVGVRVDPAEPDWPVVYIGLPAGQVSWHFSAADYARCFPGGLPTFAQDYDGHTTEEKYARALRSLPEDAHGRGEQICPRCGIRNDAFRGVDGAF